MRQLGFIVRLAVILLANEDKFSARKGDLPDNLYNSVPETEPTLEEEAVDAGASAGAHGGRRDVNRMESTPMHFGGVRRWGIRWDRSIQAFRPLEKVHQAPEAWSLLPNVRRIPVRQAESTRFYCSRRLAAA
jgi:hypothetical protein